MASFKKPLVACVKGEIGGLGARILPLFDVVYAHIDATFVAKNSELGDILEGTAIISATDKISYNAVSYSMWYQFSDCVLFNASYYLQKAKLLFLNESFEVDEAKNCNIVSQVLRGMNMDIRNQRLLIECEKLATESITVSLDVYLYIERLILHVFLFTDNGNIQTDAATRTSSKN